MSYAHYEERCFVVDEIDSGEASRSFFLLCENLGCVWARATSVRKEISKLRFHLQKYNHIKVTLIEGRDFYRVVGVDDFSGSNKYASLNILEKKLVARIMNVLRKLIVGEERENEIYNLVDSLISTLKRITIRNNDDFVAFEIFMISKILAKLGYGSMQKFLLPDSNDLSFIDHEFLQDIGAKREVILPLVNNALRESHL